MRLKFIRIIFFSIIVLLIGVSIYIIYGKDNKESVIVDSNNKETDIIKNISIGIVGYDTINPILSKNQDSQYISKLIYNSILTISQDFKLECDLAKEYTKLNNKIYLIKLKNDIFWHDGINFTSEDVKFTIESLKNITNSIYNKDVKDIETVEIIDTYTLKIYLKEEIKNFEYFLCFPILAKHAYNNETLASNFEIPIGTGNYNIKKLNEECIILKKLEDVELKITFYESVNKLYNAFAKKKVDLIYTNNINYEDYIGKIGYEINTCEGQQHTFLIINTEKINTEKRQAINYAINKNNIIYEEYNNKYTISNFPFYYKGYLKDEDMQIYKYDINKSKEILFERNTDDMLKFNMLVNKNHKQLIVVANKIKEQLEEIGIELKIISVTESDFQYYIKFKQYDLILLEETIKLNSNLKTYFGRNNLSNYYNEDIDIMLKEIKNIKDEKLLEEKYKKILKIYMEELPFISLYSNTNFILYNSNLRGDFNHNWFNLFYNIENWYKIE